MSFVVKAYNFSFVWNYITSIWIYDTNKKGKQKLNGKISYLEVFQNVGSTHLIESIIYDWFFGYAYVAYPKHESKNSLQVSGITREKLELPLDFMVQESIFETLGKSPNQNFKVWS